jgi:hypothetical protein
MIPNWRTPAAVWLAVLAPLWGEPFIASRALAVAPQKIVAAVIDFDHLPVGPLLEEQLAKNTQITWVERDLLNAILQEVALQKAFGPTEGAQRVALGAQLKADVLVLLRAVDPPEPTAKGARPRPKNLEVVVCETHDGLRLAITTQPGSDDPQADAMALVPLVTRAIERLSQRVTMVCAVPPLVSSDLFYDFDYLKTALAKVVEASLLDQPHVLVVELAEAESISRELALGGASSLRHSLPFYLLGEYRNSGRDANRRISISLRLRHGEQELGTAAAVDLTPATAPDFMLKSANGLLSKVDAARLLPADPAVEAQQLAEHARLLMRLGSWNDAMPLVEAALLLNPARNDILADAVQISGAIASGFSSDPSKVEISRRALRQYRRGLQHIEGFVRAEPDLFRYEQRGVSVCAVDRFPFFFLTRREPAAELAELYQEVLAAHRETLTRLVRLRAEILSADQAVVDGDGTIPIPRLGLRAEDLKRLRRLNPKFGLELMAVSGPVNDYRYLWFATDQLPEQQRFDIIRKTIDELQALPGFRGRAYRMARGCYAAQVFDTPTAREYLQKLCHDPRPEVRSAGERITKEVEAQLVSLEGSQPDPKISANVHGEPPLPPAPVQAVMRPVRLTYPLKDGRTALVTSLDGCQRVEENTDIVWTDNRLFYLREKGLLKPAYFFPPQANRFVATCFDGRYFWMIVANDPDTVPFLIVIDPQEKRMWKLTDAGGFPAVHPIKTTTNGGYQRFAMVALEPGKVCIAGYFGRSWIATVQFDAQRTSSFETRILHEAREQSDGLDAEVGLRTDVAFVPEEMYLLGSSVGGKADQQRVLVWRDFPHVGRDSRPLVVDVAQNRVTVIDKPVFIKGERRTSLQVCNGSLYFIKRQTEEPRSIDLVRVGYPSLRQEIVFHNAPQGLIAVDEDQVHIVGKKWWIGSLPAGTFAVAADSMPWHFINLWRYPGQPENSEKGSGSGLLVFRSAQYGWLVCDKRYLNSLMSVEFAPRAARYDLPPDR